MPDPTPLNDRLTRLTQLRERLATLQGHAESPDALIKVTCTTEDPLHDLQLHPRALKLLNADLATAIQETATAARADLRRHTDEALSTLFDADDPARALADPATAKARLSEMTTLMRSTTEDTRSAFERLRGQFGG